MQYPKSRTGINAMTMMQSAENTESKNEGRNAKHLWSQVPVQEGARNNDNDPL